MSQATGGPHNSVGILCAIVESSSSGPYSAKARFTAKLCPRITASFPGHRVISSSCFLGALYFVPRCLRLFSPGVLFQPLPLLPLPTCNLFWGVHQILQSKCFLPLAGGVVAFSLMHLSLGFWLPRCCIDQVSATDVSARQMLLSTHCVMSLPATSDTQPVCQNHCASYSCDQRGRDTRGTCRAVVPETLSLRSSSCIICRSWKLQREERVYTTHSGARSDPKLPSHLATEYT